MNYPPDPGGHFDSDAHRRVMAHLPNPDDDPISVADLITERINRDPHALQHFQDANQVQAILDDLDADGHAKQLKNGWKNTKDGFDVLTGPPSDETIAHAAATIGLDPTALSHNGDH